MLMRYFYIICLVLSSFFIYKQSSAENIPQKYAMFMPNNAYHENTAVNNLDSMQPRYKTPQQKNTIKKRKVSTPTKTSKKETEPMPKITLPFVRNPLIEATPEEAEAKRTTLSTTSSQTETLAQEAPQTEQLLPPPPASEKDKEAKPFEEVVEMPDSIKEKASQYNIDDDFEVSFSPHPQVITQKEKPKTIKEMLSAIPYPDLDAPKFKQTYGRYGITLRTFYRQKEMPTDYDQDEILAKANTSKRFLVEPPAKKTTKF